MVCRTIDYLACPTDKTPLIVDKITECSDANGILCKSRCKYYCAFHNIVVSDGIIPDCEQCQKIDVVTALLKCPQCSSSFSIENGIARMLPIEKNLPPEMQEGVAVKQKEMKLRDENAAKYDVGYSPGRNLVEINSFLKRLSLSGDDLVLELGCGTGRLTVSMTSSCKEIICIDFSFESLKELLRKYRLNFSGNIHLIQADMNFLPLRREYQFEKIVSSGAIHHIPADSKIAVIREIDSYLAPNGIFVVSVYNHSDMTEETKEKEGYHSGKIYFYRYGSDEFKDFLSNAFRVSEIAGIINLPTHKVIGILMKMGLSRFALNLEFLIQRTRLSFRRGEMLIAVCRKKDAI